MADPTPEERFEAAEKRADAIFDSPKGRRFDYVDHLRKEVAREIVDAQASARAKAFEEAAQIVEGSFGPREDGVAFISLTARAVAERIRARAKEAPHG